LKKKLNIYLVKYINLYESFLNEENLESKILDLIPDILEIEGINYSFYERLNDQYVFYIYTNDFCLLSDVSKVFISNIHLMDNILRDEYGISYKLETKSVSRNLKVNIHTKLNLKLSELVNFLKDDFRLDFIQLSIYLYKCI